MEADDEYRRKAQIALVTVVVLASLAVASLFVAFSYYCYIRNKVSKRLKNQKSKLHLRIASNDLFADYGSGWLPRKSEKMRPPPARNMESWLR